jgi:hypothetical protein
MAVRLLESHFPWHYPNWTVGYHAEDLKCLLAHDSSSITNQLALHIETHQVAKDVFERKGEIDYIVKTKVPVLRFSSHLTFL